MRSEPAGARPNDLGALYDRLAPSLYRYALMILADPAGAEDAVQQVFAAVVRRGVGDLDSAEGYLRRAIRNECYDTLRSRRRRPEAANSDTLLEAVTAAEDRPDDRMALTRALQQLPPDQREVVHLKVFEGCTFQEIGVLLDESMNTIASRYRYAMEKLRAVLGDEWGVGR